MRDVYKLKGTGQVSSYSFHFTSNNHSITTSTFPTLTTQSKMRSAIAIILAVVLVGAMALPYPQNFDEAVKQAQQMSLIPAGAQIDRTFSGTQVAYFQLGRNDRVNGGDLKQALDGVPAEILANLEAQIANAQ